MEMYGIRAKILKWVESFLSNRRQRVVLEENVSILLNVSSGVPQSSVLGPILFLMYNNDLPDYLKNKCKLDADDCKVFQIIRKSIGNDLRRI